MMRPSRAISLSISIRHLERRRRIAARRVLALALFLLASLGAYPAQSTDGDDVATAVLRIETGMHNAAINRLAVTDGGDELITVSDDKTTRRWSLADGAARGIWRTPIGDGDDGALFAMAATGDTVVIGGHTGRKTAALYVLDRRTGQMRGSIGGFAAAISALAFSPDGRYLAVGEQSGGVTLIDFSGRKLVGQDRDYTGTVEWIAFGADGRLATSAADGKLRLYGAGLKRLVENSAERPWGLAFSPDGKRLAVGSLTSGKLRLFATDTLKPEQTLEGAPGKRGALSVVAWSADGTRLAAAGTYKDGSERRLIRFWHVRDRDIAGGQDVAVAGDTVTDLALLADGRAVYVTAEPSFGVVAEDGQQTVHRGGAKADFRDSWRDAFRVSHDGGVVEFASAPGGKRFRFDLRAGSLVAEAAPHADLHRPVLERERIKVTDWQNGAEPKLNGQIIRLEQAERVHSIAILPDAGRVALGTDFYLRLERASADTRNSRPDHGGGEAWRKVVPAPVWSVNASGDGRYVIAALGDGTIRWYAAADGREVMALYVDPRDRRWVVWTPEGFFDHSRAPGRPGGETLVGYQLDNGPNKLADFVEIGQLYNLFYRRDLVLAKFQGGAAAERNLAQQLARIGDVRAVLKAGLPARIELAEACIRPAGAAACPAGSSVKPADPRDRRFAVTGAGSEFFARYRIEDRGGGLGRVIVRRNGAVIEGAHRVETADARQRTETVILPLDPARNEIRFATESRSAAIQSRADDDVIVEATATADATAPGPAASAAGVQLFVVAIGVSDYQRAEFRLANAANDARAIAELLRQPSPPVYERAEVELLLDRDATNANIMAALRKVAAKARPQDIVVIFFSGHGEAVDGKYFFAPVDFASRHPALLAKANKANEQEIIDELFREDGFGEAELLPMLEKIQGSLLLMLDTCFSGALTDDPVERNARNEVVTNSVGHKTGRFILAAARNLALDSNGAEDGSDRSGHGLFTTTLLDGLEGGADLDHKGRINVLYLMTFTDSRMREESRRLKLDQEPAYYFTGNKFFDIRALPAKR